MATRTQHGVLRGALVWFILPAVFATVDAQAVSGAAWKDTPMLGVPSVSQCRKINTYGGCTGAGGADGNEDTADSHVCKDDPLSKGAKDENGVELCKGSEGWICCKESKCFTSYGEKAKCCNTDIYTVCAKG